MTRWEVSNWQVGDVNATRMKGDFHRVHSNDTSFAINSIARDGGRVSEGAPSVRAQWKRGWANRISEKICREMR